MHIVCVSFAAIDEAQGPAIHVTEIAEGLARIGHKLTLLTPTYRIKRTLSNVNVVKYGNANGRCALTNNIKLLKSLYMIYYRSPYAVIYFRDCVSCVAVPIISKLTGVPYVLEVNNIPQIQRSVEAEDFPTNAGNRLAVLNGKLRKWIGDLIFHGLCKSAARILPLTYGCERMLRDDFGISRDKIHVVPDGVNLKLFFPRDKRCVREKLGIEQDCPILGYVGSVHSYKGVEVAIRAFGGILAAVHDARLVVVGSGPLLSRYKQLARELGFEDSKVRFVNEVSIEESAEWMSSLDIGLALSKPTPTGWSPIKVFSYMACGVPVIATRTSGLEIVEETKAGILVDPDDTDEVTQACIGLLRDPDRRRKMGENGRINSVERSSWEKVCSKVSRLCEEVVKK